MNQDDLALTRTEKYIKLLLLINSLQVTGQYELLIISTLFQSVIILEIFTNIRKIHFITLTSQDIQWHTILFTLMA